MKIPFSLLKEYVDLEKMQASEVAEILTLLGIEVENIENEKAGFSNVVSASVESVEPHPSADRLTVANVFDGSNFYQVVCGAKNCRAGIKTAFAKIGAKVTSDGKEIEIKKAKLRNVESFGMLCSKPELGMGEGDGIIELPEDTSLGLDLTFLIDPILEISLTPNLGHCMSVIGIARELGAYLNKKVKYPSLDFFKDEKLKTAPKVKIKEGAFRYSGLSVNNLEIKPSPSWLKNHLESSGFRSVNNVVDVLNFVMFEMGQPLHAFDSDKIGKEIHVSLLKKEENILCLDDEQRKIPKDSLVIADEEKILAIAGIMGGKSSSVGQTTKNIFVESAAFDPLLIRKTSKNISLRSESSLRFEKGTDPNVTCPALNRVAHLLQKICPECKISGIIDISEKEFHPLKIACRISRVNKILGTNLSLNEIRSIFHRLEFQTSIQDENLIVIVPTYRNDIKKEIDLIEEVARIFGYNNLEKRPALFKSSAAWHCPEYIFETKLKHILISLGLQEVITCDLISPKMSQILVEKSLPKSSLIEVLYAKSEEQSILRPSFLPSFLQVAKNNFDHKNFDVCAFEIGKVHFKKQEEFIEEEVFALMLCGKNNPHNFDQKPNDFDFFDLKGILENLFQSLKIEKFHFEKSSHPCFHPGRQAKIFVENIEIGTIGEVHSSVLQQMDIKKPVFFSEINMHHLMKKQKLNIKYVPLAQYPSSERDWTIPLSKDVSYISLLENIESPLLEQVFLLDLYIDPKKPEQKNLTLRFIYRDKNKTISFEEVEKEHAKIIEEVSKIIKELEKRSHNK